MRYQYCMRSKNRVASEHLNGEREKEHGKESLAMFLLWLSVRFGEARLLVQESDGRAIQTVRSTVSAKKPKILSSLRKKALCCAQTLYWKRERAAPASLARSSA